MRDMVSTLSMPLMNGIFWAGEELPEEDRYDGYLQLENGVGMAAAFWVAEVRQAVVEGRWR